MSAEARPSWLAPDHPSRASLYAETHARPVEPLAAPARIRRVTFLSTSNGADLAQLVDAMSRLLGPEVRANLAEGVRQFSFSRDDRRAIWELHNEFSTLTWVAPADDWVAWPEGIGLEQHRGLLLLSATRIDVIPTLSITAGAFRGLNPVSLAYSRIFDGSAEVATDFVVDGDGFTRIEVAAGSCGDLRRGIIVRRLLEVETYRQLTLLGLPLARSLSGRIQKSEAALAAAMQDIGTASTMEDNRRGLDILHSLAIEVGQTVEETSFRFAATRAYGNILRSRLQRLGEAAIGEYSTIQRYLDNRVEPALATCDAIEKRLEALTTKISRSTALLNANISLSIQSQNRAVLDTILTTAQSQYRLQQTVEGLSIIAISYYAVGLLGYILEGLHDVLPIEKSLAVALLAPVVLLLVWASIRRIRRSHS